MTLAGSQAMLRVLVVDDEPNGREGLCTLLQEEGFVVADARDGEEGLSKLLSFNPDAVLCDMGLPRLDGLSFLLKARQMGSRVGFVMMTAGRTGVEEVLRSGADGCLPKPLDLASVLSELRK